LASNNGHTETVKVLKDWIAKEKKGIVKESFKNNIFEGGNIFDQTSSIAKENIIPTVEQFKKKLSQIFPKVHFDFQFLGSAGKKEISGDIDLGLSEDLIIDKNEEVKCEDWGIDRKIFDEQYILTRKRARTASEKQSKMQTIVKLISNKLLENGVMSDPKKSGANTLFCGFSQYDNIGNSINKTVQVDINIGNIDWLKFSYYSEVYKDNVKGLHRTQLLVALFSNKKRLFRHGTGVYNSATGKYESNTPQGAIDLLNKLYNFKNVKLNNEIINNFFKLHEFLVKNLSESELHNVYDIYLKILDSTRTDIPIMLQDYWIKNKDRLGLQGKFLPEESNLYKYTKWADQQEEIEF